MRHAQTLVAVLAIFALAGCQSMTPRQAAYQSLGAIVLTVDQARSAYADAINLGQVSEEKQGEIDMLISKYQIAMNAALTAAEMDYSSAAPSEVAAIAAQVTSAILLITGNSP
jgi:hypothetical protein